MTRRLSWLPVAAVMAGTTFVAVTAFVLAFDGSRGAAADAGIAQAGWYPWCIEGVIVCASLCTLVLDRRWPWFILLAFTAVSVAANVLHAWEQPGWMWWSLAFAAVPPLALPICVHLGLMVIGRPRQGGAAEKEVTDGEADESREGRGTAGVQGGQGGAGREQGQDGDGQVPGREQPGDRGGEERPLVPAALGVTDADGSGDPVPVRNPDPSARETDDLEGPFNDDVEGEPIKVISNGHPPTKTEQAIGAIAAYKAANGDRLPSISQLAAAGFKPGTAQRALALTRKG